MFSISQISCDHSQIVLISLRIMYIIILLRYISYAYNISSACESNWMELPINLFIIIMYQMIVFSNYNNFF